MDATRFPHRQEYSHLTHRQRPLRRIRRRLQVPERALVALEKTHQAQRSGLLELRSGRLSQKLISRSEYDLIMTLKVNGTFRGKTDGVLINLSPDNVMQKISYYEPSDARDFGFINKLFGLVIAVRQSPKSQGNNTHSKSELSRCFQCLCSLLREPDQSQGQPAAKDPQHGDSQLL